MTAAGRIGFAVVLLIGAVSAEAQLDEAHCPPAPTLIIDGTVLEVAVPRARCWPEIVATGAETCLTGRVDICANGPTATAQMPGRPIRKFVLTPQIPGWSRATNFRVCPITPGAYNVTLCVDDPEPVACAFPIGAGQSIDVRSIRPLPTVHVRVKVDAVVLGEAGAEVTFAGGARPHRAGDRGRFELHRTVTIADPPTPSEYVERDCYQRRPTPVTRRGCAGCSGGGAPSWIGVAAVIAFLRLWRR